jgi:hypothetical protein
MMSGKHYILEGSSYGIVRVRTADSEDPIAGFPSLQHALDCVKFLNPEDEPEIVEFGKR